MNGFKQYKVSCEWLLSLHIMCSEFIPRIFHCMNTPLFIDLSVEEHLGCFNFGACMNNAVMNICEQLFVQTCFQLGFPGGAVVKNLPANAGDAGDTGSISGLGRSPGGGHGNPLQYSCLENLMDRGA